MYKDLYNEWMSSGEKSLTAAGNVRAPDQLLCLEWPKRAWRTVTHDVIVHSFKACRIFSSTDSPDDGCIQSEAWWSSQQCCRLFTSIVEKVMIVPLPVTERPSLMWTYVEQDENATDGLLNFTNKTLPTISLIVILLLPRTEGASQKQRPRLGLRPYHNKGPGLVPALIITKHQAWCPPLS